MAAALAVAACATVREPGNASITEVVEDQGYRRISSPVGGEVDDQLVLLAFSGGGTRAAALSYGVMQELRDTRLPRDAGYGRLLDEVDSISSVSGGSFTAAYYGLYRERLFEDFEQGFLKRSVQSDLIRRLLNPAQWFRSASHGFDRTEMTIDYYDRYIFNGATFADMGLRGPPYIDINATDLVTGMRFTFSQDLFDLICSNLSSFSVARAVTASSAVPVVFPSVVIENHADQCALGELQAKSFAVDPTTLTVQQRQLQASLASYRDAEKRRYIHLIDGGIADNLGLRTIIDRLEGLSRLSPAALAEQLPERVLVILVNAEVERDALLEQTPRNPSPDATMGAYTSAQMGRYNQDSYQLLEESMDAVRALARKHDRTTRFYFAEVTFRDLEVAGIAQDFNEVATSLELSDREVDQLIVAGRLLLRKNTDFIAYKNAEGAALEPGALDIDQACQYFAEPDCPRLLSPIERAQ